MQENFQEIIKIPQKVLSIRSLKSLKTQEFLEYREKINFFELRLDLFANEDLLHLYDLSLLSQKWIIKSDCLDKILSFLDSFHAIVDIDFLSQQHWIAKLPKNTTIILSCHGSCNKDSFHEIYESMLKIPADYYKLVIDPSDMIEGLKIIHAIQTVQDKRWTIFLTGARYQFSRVLSVFFHQTFLYLCLKGFETAPGQFSIKEWMDYFDVKTYPTFLGLIGDPVDKSCSQKVYNSYFRKMNIDAVYLKIQLASKEFIEGVYLLKKIGFLGLSITTPHKGRAAYFANHLNSVNTLILKDPIEGYQTDGTGLIDLVKTKLPIQGSRVLILGVGGAGVACALAFYNSGANIFVLNRTKEKIKELLQIVPVQVFDENEKRPFDIVIQATSKEFFGDTSPHALFPINDQTLFCELVSSPLFTNFLKNRMQQNGLVFFGFEHFLAQGLKQLEFFLPDENHVTFYAEMRRDALDWFLSLV